MKPISTKKAASVPSPSKKAMPAKKAGSKKQPNKAAGGRPSAFTPAAREAILKAISDGNTLNTSAVLGGVTYQTFRNWIKQGEAEGKGEYFAFGQAVQQAQAKAEREAVENILAAARGGALIEQTTITTTRTARNGTKTTETRTYEKRTGPDHRAAAFWLERRNPQEWGRNDRLTTTNFNYDLSALSDDQFNAFDQLTSNGVDPAIAYAEALNRKTES